MTLDRRDFLKGAIGLSGAALVGQGIGAARLAAWAEADAPLGHLPPPSQSGIDHVVVVMMENRSFDHFLGWFPGANGRQRGLSYPDPAGHQHKTYHLAQYNGCGFVDPDHSYTGARVQYDLGKMDGFLTDTANDLFAVGYYQEKDRPFMGALARHYTTGDNYFCAFLGPTFPNRFFMHAGATDRIDNTLTVCTLPTIWDQLNQPGGPTGTYYYSDIPFLALFGNKYTSISAPIATFLADAKAGTLPSVSYVDPKFFGEAQGTGNDDHPLNDIRAGDAFLDQIFAAVSTGPKWANTVLVINYDEWGGFFEHVAPPRVTPGVPGVDTDVDANGNVLLGFRVPCIVASPFTKGRQRSPRVVHPLLDHTSILRMIEWRWDLAPVAGRDGSTRVGDPVNLAHAFNFSDPDPTVPSLPVVTAPTPMPCMSAAGNDTWGPLAASGLLAPFQR